LIEVRDLRFAYARSERAALDGASFVIEPGEFVLLAGPSGGGKSTLLRCLNGLVPHFHGGSFSGRVVIEGRDTRDHEPRDLADVVGLVLQDPEAQVVAETVEDEIAFGMENLGLKPSSMRKRVEEVVDLVGIEALRGRRLDTLSGGELQRVAIAAVMTMQPKVLLLDEPTSQLDPQAAEDVLSCVQRLSDELGLTVVLAEHRLERVVQHASRLLYLPGDGSVQDMETRYAMATLSMAPPVSRLGRSLGWNPLPLSVREARRFVNGAGLAAPPPAAGATSVGREVAIEVSEATVSYDGVPALRGLSLVAREGELIALMGRNGAGKTTLLRALVALTPLDTGSALVLGKDIASTRTELLAPDVAFVPQDASTVLYHDYVREELEDVAASLRRGCVDDAEREWRLEELLGSHTDELSAGERQRVALATMLMGAPRLVLLDEPTRGMDFETKELLVKNLRRRCDAGATVIIASHDVELAARCATRVVLLSGGEVVVDGPARAVLTETLTFSTQVNKLFGKTFLVPEDLALLAEAPG
jgi:energy-coupling factor transport system ATP-binding protein